MYLKELGMSRRLGKSRKTSLMALCSNCDCSDILPVWPVPWSCPVSEDVLPATNHSAGSRIRSHLHWGHFQRKLRPVWNAQLCETLSNRDKSKAQSSFIPAFCTLEQVCLGAWTSTGLVSEKSEWLQLVLCDALQVLALKVVIGP